MRVAFIGLGNMGLPMARNLVKAGIQVMGFDLNAKAVETLVQAGGKAASSARDALVDAEVVISMLPASKHVKALMQGEDGLLKALATGTLVIDCSTIAASVAREISKEAAGLGIDLIDAPVSGGTAGAEGATLTFMVGATPAQLRRAQPLLEKMGKRILHAGESGAGQTAKACNNMALGIAMIGASEALQLGIASGLDPKVLSEIMKNSSAGSWVMNVYNPVPGVMDGVPASRGYSGGFGVDLMLKDLGLAEESARELGATVPLGGLARQLYAMHSANGNGALDFSSIFEMLAARKS